MVDQEKRVALMTGKLAVIGGLIALTIDHFSPSGFLFAMGVGLAFIGVFAIPRPTP